MSKKTFRTVATTFFSEATQKQEPPKPTKAKAVKPQPQAKSEAKKEPTARTVTHETETKARRVQLILKPSTYEIAKEAAYKARLSFNEYIHKLIEEHNK